MSSDQAIVTVKDTSVPEKRKTKKSKKEISKKKKKSKKTSPAAGEIKESKSLVSTLLKVGCLFETVRIISFKSFSLPVHKLSSGRGTPLYISNQIT